jgi:hypothetical protein
MKEEWLSAAKWEISRGLGSLRLKPDDVVHFKRPSMSEQIEELKKTDVILAVDKRDPKRELLFYGRAALEEIEKSGEARKLYILRIPIRFSKKSLKRLAAFITEHRGQCDY